MRSGNPTLTESAFGALALAGETMTLDGVVHRAAALLVIAFVAAAWTWHQVAATGGRELVLPFLLVGGIGGLLVAILTIFVKRVSPFTAPVYAFLEGLVLGTLSALMEARFPGIVLHAVGLTFGVLACMLIAYRSGLIAATENFKLAVVSGTGAVCLIYIVDLALAFAGHRVPFVHESGFWGIAFSLFVVALAAMNLVIDFDFVETGVANGSPKFMEWYAAFGLIVTLIWLYLEILRLLGKSRR